jgi:hypothetical protein
MAPPRTFDYELLKQLVREHPDWSYHDYARVLTLDMRNRTGDPGYPFVMPNTVAAAIGRNRDRWAEEGIRIEDNRVPVYSELIPRSWYIAPSHKMDTELRHLRVIARLRRGVETSSKEERQARQFEQRLRTRREVVDVSPRGRPVIRPAEPWELDETGQLREIVAQPRPRELQGVAS